MSVQTPQEEDLIISPIIEAKSLLSDGNARGALTVLKKAADYGDVMACYDAGFMIIKGIGCRWNDKKGLDLIEKGAKLEKGSKDMSWKSDGSVTELIQSQSMVLLS